VVLVALELIDVGDRSDYATLFFVLIPDRVVAAYDFMDDRLLMKSAIRWLRSLTAWKPRLSTGSVPRKKASVFCSDPMFDDPETSVAYVAELRHST